MIPRNIIEELVEIALLQNEGYKSDIKWKDFQDCTLALPTDRIIEFKWKEWTGIPAFSMEDQERTYYTFYMVVGRNRPENDEEYFKRLKNDEERKKEIENRERLEYLRLKAKFE